MSVASLPLRRRSPRDGGYVRGEETRQRIVDAALEMFAEEGFARASTRRIAAAAGVTPPALQYYFDSKEGLHRACADRIIAQVAARMEPVLAAGRAALRDGGPDEAQGALCLLVDLIADLTLTPEEAPVWRRFVARASEDDAGGAYPRIKAAIGAPIQALARSLTARATGRPEDEEGVRLRALLLLGQLSTFHHNRDQAMQAAGWTELDAGRIAALKTVARENTRAMIQAGRESSPS